MKYSEKDIYDMIHKLPKEIRHKIYIKCMRNFWRQYVPLTAKVPTWYKHSIENKKVWWEAQYKNIHILHLDCNTLPENKKWIMGCQCEFCKQYPTNLKTIEYKKQQFDSSYFEYTMPYTFTKWNSKYHFKDMYETIQYEKIFDPLYELNSFEYKTLTFSYPYEEGIHSDDYPYFMFFYLIDPIS